MDKPETSQQNTHPKNHQEILAFAQKCQPSRFKDGEIVASPSGKDPHILAAPILWGLDQSMRYRYWNVYIALTSSSSDTPQSIITIPIEPQFLEDRVDPPKGISGVYWTVSGLEGTENPIVSALTYVTIGKGWRANNTRASNYTTVLTQAIFDAKSMHEAKIKDGMQLDKSQLHGSKVVNMKQMIARPQTTPGIPQWRVFGMAVHDFNKHKKHIQYPCYVDPKYDGTMFIMVAHPDLPAKTLTVVRDGAPKKVFAHVDAYSRGRKNVESQDHIVIELYPTLKKYPGLHIVGELWRKGMSLQDISGATRRTADSSRGDAEKLQLHVFDCFRIDERNLHYEQRRDILDAVFDELPDGLQYIVRVPSKRCANEEAVMETYKKHLEDKLEGAVVRNDFALYEFGFDNEPRTYDTLKLKPRPDEEYPVVGFEHGNGKEEKAVKWICCENDKGVLERLGELIPLAERYTFKVTPNQPTALRNHIYEKISRDGYFKKYVYGKLVTVSMLDRSKGKLLPVQPKVLRFFEKEMDLKLQEGYIPP